MPISRPSSMQRRMRSRKWQARVDRTEERLSMSAKIDPITRSVVQHRLSSIVKEMGEAMLRTSYSQILNSSRDFSLAICATSARLLAQADHLPVHVGALPWATIAVEE